jgi:hypothetical protein
VAALTLYNMAMLTSISRVGWASKSLAPTVEKRGEMSHIGFQALLDCLN